MIKKFLFTAFLITYCALSVYSQNYPIVDTGQKIYYNNTSEISAPDSGEAFYGQDAQYNGNQPSYTLSNDALTVYDNVTGLTWIRNPDTDGDGDLDTYDQLTWSEFLSYPDTLNAENFGGYNDWRVPTIKELYSLVDFSGTDPNGIVSGTLTPFIDTTYFDFVYGDESVGERIIDAQYWSSNIYTGTVFGDQIADFGVNFADGRIKGYPRDMGPGGIAVHYARYVRGNTDYGINDFTDNGDGIITDNATGLMWSQNDWGNSSESGPLSGMKWEDALSFVQQKNSENYLGYNDWRLPNAKEMESIVDYSRSPDETGSGAIDSMFNITQITNEKGDVDFPWYWTSTTHVKNNEMGDAAAYVCFGRALGYMNNTWLDVHGSGCQRSDRKEDNFSGYTFNTNGYYNPIAPQGDAVRILNYIRLVRDVSTTGVNESSIESPTKFKLEQNYPNPFNPSTTISFSIPFTGDTSLKIYNIIGQEVAELVNEYLLLGNYSFKWNAENQPSGIYFYKLVTDSYSEMKKMVLIK